MYEYHVRGYARETVESTLHQPHEMFFQTWFSRKQHSSITVTLLSSSKLILARFDIQQLVYRASFRAFRHPNSTAQYMVS